MFILATFLTVMTKDLTRGSLREKRAHPGSQCWGTHSSMGGRRSDGSGRPAGQRHLLSGSRELRKWSWAIKSQQPPSPILLHHPQRPNSSSKVLPFKVFKPPQNHL